MFLYQIALDLLLNLGKQKIHVEGAILGGIEEALFDAFMLFYTGHGFLDY